MPANVANSDRVSSWCTAWPNSWNDVVTSPWLSSARAPAVGFGKLTTTAAIGTRRDPSAIAFDARRRTMAACLYLSGRG